jgi:Brp/Blh family beta-carotene 15,15'-monooxygenase
MFEGKSTRGRGFASPVFAAIAESKPGLAGSRAQPFPRPEPDELVDFQQPLRGPVGRQKSTGQGAVWLWRGSAAALLIATLAEGVFGSFSDRYAAVPFVLGLLTVGMWHGALDSVEVIGRPRWSSAIKYLVWYLVLMGVAAAALLGFSAVAITAFLLLTMVHFGAEDTEFLLAQRARASGDVFRSGSRGDRRAFSHAVVLSFARGLQAIVLPLVVHSQASGDFFRRVQHAIGRQRTRFPWEHERIASLLLLALLALTLFAVMVLWRHRQLLRLWVAESALVSLGAVMLNPEFFVGLYLLAWHAPRHLLVRFEGGTGGGAARPAASPRSDLLYSLLFLVPAWAAVGGLVWTRGDALTGWIARQEPFHAVPLFASLSAATVAVYVVVTLPHHLLQHGGWVKSVGGGGGELPSAVAKRGSQETVSAEDRGNVGDRVGRATRSAP